MGWSVHKKDRVTIKQSFISIEFWNCRKANATNSDTFKNESLSLSIPLVMCIRIESSWSDLDFEVGLIELKGTVRGPLFIMDSLINYMDFMMMHFMCTCFPILHGWPWMTFFHFLIFLCVWRSCLGPTWPDLTYPHGTQEPPKKFHDKIRTFSGATIFFFRCREEEGISIFILFFWEWWLWNWPMYYDHTISQLERLMKIHERWCEFWWEDLNIEKKAYKLKKKFLGSSSTFFFSPQSLFCLSIFPPLVFAVIEKKRIFSMNGKKEEIFFSPPNFVKKAAKNV